MQLSAKTTDHTRLHVHGVTFPLVTEAKCSFGCFWSPWWQPQGSRAAASGKNTSGEVGSGDPSLAAGSLEQRPLIHPQRCHPTPWKMRKETAEGRKMYKLQIFAPLLLLNVSVHLSYKAQFLLWGQYWQVCLFVRMSGSGDNRLCSPRLSTQLWMWWIKVFLSFSNSERRFQRQLWRLSAIGCGQRLSSRTSAVHVAGHYRVQIPSLEVQQKASFRAVSLQAHQSVKNDLHRETHTFNW